MWESFGPRSVEIVMLRVNSEDLTTGELLKDLIMAIVLCREIQCHSFSYDYDEVKPSYTRLIKAIKQLRMHISFIGCMNPGTWQADSTSRSR